jgi:DNA-binding PadR family transcriptional regulator
MRDEYGVDDEGEPGWHPGERARRAYAARRAMRGGRGRGGFPMGEGGPFFRGRPRVSRGDVRAAVLALLTEEPRHGYQIIQDLAERTDGVWRPSPGSIYPTLQMLEDEGLVQAVETEGKKVYHLTDEGRQAVEPLETPPWENLGVDDAHVELRDLAFQVGAAVMQVAHAGTRKNVEKAKAILVETRKQLYGLLAGGDEPDA